MVTSSVSGVYNDFQPYSRGVVADVIYLTKSRAFLDMNELHFLLERRRQRWDHVMLKSESVVMCSVFYNLL